jgi:hypothetical protein
MKCGVGLQECFFHYIDFFPAISNKDVCWQQGQDCESVPGGRPLGRSASIYPALQAAGNSNTKHLNT